MASAKEDVRKLLDRLPGQLLVGRDPYHVFVGAKWSGLWAMEEDRIVSECGAENDSFTVNHCNKSRVPALTGGAIGWCSRAATAPSL